MNAQEMFDKVLSHLRMQGRPSIGDRGICSYRGHGEDMCAAGVLIPDSCYRPTMEGHRVKEILGHPTWRLPDYIAANIELVQAMQYVHDGAAGDLSMFLADLEKGMEKIADSYGLLYSPPMEVLVNPYQYVPSLPAPVPTSVPELVEA